MALHRLLIGAILSLLIPSAFAQPINSMPPDCTLQFSFSATGQTTTNFDNRFIGCQNWYISYSTYNVSGLNLTVQSAPDANGTPGTFVTFIGPESVTPYSTDSKTGSFVPWVNITESATFSTTGLINGALIGWKPGRNSSSSGGVTSVSSGNLSPLFTSTVLNSTTTPDIVFNLSTFGADNIFGNFTGSTAAPSTQAIPACANDGAHALVYVSHVLTCEAVTGAPAFSAITNGTNSTAAMVVGTGASLAVSGSGTIAATSSTALSGTPSLCSTGQAPTGILPNGNATGCAAPSYIEPYGADPTGAVDASTIFATAVTNCNGELDIPAGSYTIGTQLTAWGANPCYVVMKDGAVMTTAWPPSDSLHQVFYQSAIPILPPPAVAPFPVVSGISIPSLASTLLLGLDSNGDTRAATANSISAVYIATGGGTAQAQTATLSPAITALVAGTLYCWVPSNSNTTSAPTLALNGLTAQPITKYGAVTLVAGDVKAGAINCVYWDGTRFELQVPFSISTNCSISASPAVCGSAPNGSVAIPTGVTSVTLTVNTTAVTNDSQILLTADDTLARLGVTCNSTLATLVGGMAITARTARTSFQITYNGTIATNPLCVSYSIIN